MTRKHFEALARELKARQPSTKDQRIGWFQAVSAVMSAAEQFNPRFDRKKFYAACGIDVSQYP